MGNNKEPIEEATPLQGQETFPGFEDQKPDAETIDKAARKISFQMDFIRDPEDALAAWGVPSNFFSGYLSSHFEKLVKKAAEMTGADPEQIRDKDRRTPEQQQLLTEIAGMEMLARQDAFFKSLYSDALTWLFDIQIQDNGVVFSDSFEDDVIREQSVIYFFAIHRELKPLKAGTITPEQREELTEIYKKLNSFYEEKAAEIGEMNIKYGETLSEFIRLENPPKEAAEIIAAITVKQIDRLIYPLDKPNNTIWDGITIADKNGQLQYALDTRKHGTSTPAIVYIGLDLSALPEGLSKNLDALDKRLMIASDALYHAGNEFFTDTQLYKSMGYKGNPGKSDLQKINDRLTKLGTGRIFIDNTQEIEQNKKYPKYIYDGNIMPFERIQGPVIINGKPCESVIHLFRDPPLMDFARKRDQITAIPLEVLESPISKTEENLAIEDYLLERIGQMKSPKRNSQKKILYKTLCTRCGITKPKQIRRAPEKICRYLDHFKACKWIKDYKQEQDGIKIIL